MGFGIPNTEYVPDSYTPGDYVYVEPSNRCVGLGVSVLGKLSKNVELNVQDAKQLRKVLKRAIREVESR